MDRELITVATSYNLIEAELFRNYLETEGFEVYLADDNVIGANAFLVNAIGGIKIRVPSDEAEKAAAFIENLRNAEIIQDDESNMV